MTGSKPKAPQPPKAPEKITVGVRLDRRTVERIDANATKRGIRRSDVVRELVMYSVERVGGL